MNLIEKATASVAATTETSFQEQFSGPFLLYIKPLKESSELDVSFSTSIRLVASKVGATNKLAPNENLHHPRVPTSITSLAELQQYYFLFSIEKSPRSTFAQGITIGRTNNNDIVLQEATVSKFHAWIQRPTPPGDEFRIFDAQSHYGTRVDNIATAPQGTLLRSGATIRFGSTTVTFLNSAAIYRWVREKHFQFLK